MRTLSFNPLDYSVCFTQPLRLAPSTCTSHLPIGMFLVQLLQPKTLVELGSCYGVSYCSFCQAVDILGLQTKCFAVDTWEGNEQSGFLGEQVYKDLKQYHEPLYGRFSTLLRSTFDDAASSFKDGSIDLLHIDGYQTYKSLKNNFAVWLPKVSESGVILFHDIHAHEKDFGAWKLWEELQNIYPSFEFTHGVGVIAVSNLYPKNLDLLFKLPKDEVPAVQDFFHILGRNVEIQYEKSRLEDQLTEEKKHSQEVGSQLEAWERRWAVLQHTTGWRILQKIQALRQRIFPPGSWQDRLIQSTLALRLLGKDALYIVLRYLGRNFRKKSTQSIEVSIIIPVFNLLHLTQACLGSIYRETKLTSFEIIVVDNASMDATPRWLIAEKMRKQNLKVLSQTKNIGFGPAINKGMEHSKGKFIVILNNDTIVAPGWMENLIAAMESDHSIGIISPVTNYVGNGLQKDENAGELSTDPAVISEYASRIAQKSKTLYEPNRLVFFCVLLRRELVDRIGYLDISYETGNFEDDDYCFRARLAGYRLGIALNSFVYHLGSATFSGNNIPHAELMERNSQKFYRKVGQLATSSFHFPSTSSGSIEVSVILRTMNRSKDLHNALMSLANQTYKDFEVVIINDGSEDIAEQLLTFRDHLHITYIRHERNKGRSAAANTGLDHSKGKWITFLDDDDIVYPWHLESLAQSAIMSGSQFVYSDFNQAIYLTAGAAEPDILRTPASWDFDMEDFLVINHIPIHCWLFSRDCIKNVGKMNESLDRLEDYDFLLRFSALHPFHHLPKVTCEYRFYQPNQNSVFMDINKTLKALKAVYESHPVQDRDLQLRRARMMAKIQQQIETVKGITDNAGITLSTEEANREIVRTMLEL